MKDKKKVEELIAALKAELDTPMEISLLESFEKRINGDLPRVTVIDEDHQEFNGHIYKRATNKGKPNYFARVDWLHRAVMESYVGEIPKGYDVHHAAQDATGYFDTTKNNIEDLRLMPESEHLDLHHQLRRTDSFICKNCGKEFTAAVTGKNCFCSQKCNNQWRRKNLLVELVCPICGKIFTTPKRHRQTKCCSKSCAYQLRLLLYGTDKSNVKLSDADVEFIRVNYKAGDKEFGQKALAQKFKVNRKTIESIVHNRTHKNE